MSELEPSREELLAELRRMVDGCQTCGGVGYGHQLDRHGNIVERYPNEVCPNCGPARRMLANHEGTAPFHEKAH